MAIDTIGIRVWDILSGTSILKPWDEELVESLLKFLPSKKAKILDLGGGLGNPSLGLAKYGFNVTMVDLDADFITEVQKRKAKWDLKVEIVHSSIEEYLKDCDIRYDLVLILGNALGYQDSWPNNEVNPQWREQRITATLRMSKNVLNENGVLLVETKIEKLDTGQLKTKYTRKVFAPFKLELTGTESSEWTVECNSVIGSRKIFTRILSPKRNDRQEMEILYSGYLITKELWHSIKDNTGMAFKLYNKWPREVFDCFQYRNE